MARYSAPNPGLDRPKGKDIRALRRALGFLRPYRLRVFFARHVDLHCLFRLIFSPRFCGQFFRLREIRIVDQLRRRLGG